MQCIMSLGEEIEQRRKARNLKQSNLAGQLGVQLIVARWESKKVRPRARTLERLALALGRTVEELTQTEKEVEAAVASRPVLQDVIQQLPKLSDHQLEALRVVITDMATRSQMESLLKGRS